MDAQSEAHVSSRVAGDVEALGRLESSLVAVGRGEQHADAGVLGDLRARDHGPTRRAAEDVLDGCIETQHFLDHVGQPLGLVEHALELVRVVE